MTIGDKARVEWIIRWTPEFTPEEVKVALELVEIYLNSGVVSGYYILVAEADSIICGYICYGPSPMTEGTWDIYWMAVDGDRKRQGIGRTLLKEAERKIAKDHGRLIIIETSSQESYEPTRQFHYSQGYELIATVPDYYSPGDDRLILRKSLG